MRRLLPTLLLLCALPLSGSTMSGLGYKSAAFDLDCSQWSNLEVEFDGDSLGAVSSTIATWSDTSGNGNDATQSTESYKPTVAILGNGKAARFDGTDDWLTFATKLSTTGAYTSAVVAYFDDLSAGHFLLATSNSNGQMYYQHTTGEIYHRTTFNGDFAGTAGSVSATTRHIVVSGRDSSGNLFAYVDGVDRSTNTAMSGTVEANRFGRRQGYTTSNMDGDVGSTCIWLADHEANEQQIYEHFALQYD